MKRFLLAGILAVLGVTSVSAEILPWRRDYIPSGVRSSQKKVNRIDGFWLQPTRGPLYDYSSYFAAMYPYLPGAQEYRWQPTSPGAFGTSVAVLPTVPPPPPPAPRNAARPATPANPATPMPVQPAPETKPLPR